MDSVASSGRSWLSDLSGVGKYDWTGNNKSESKGHVCTTKFWIDQMKKRDMLALSIRVNVMNTFMLSCVHNTIIPTSTKINIPQRFHRNVL